MKRSYWLIKTEPDEWSWTQQVNSGNKGAEWNGVRNFQAAKNLRNIQTLALKSDISCQMFTPYQALGRHHQYGSMRILVHDIRILYFLIW